MVSGDNKELVVLLPFIACGWGFKQNQSRY